MPRNHLSARSIFTSAALMAVAHAFSSPAAAQITTIEVDEAVADWTFDESTGRVFGSWAEKGLVVEYDPVTGKELRRFEVGAQPRQLIVKGRWLVASVHSPGSLVVVDLTSN